MLSITFILFLPFSVWNYQNYKQAFFVEVCLRYFVKDLNLWQCGTTRLVLLARTHLLHYFFLLKSLRNNYLVGPDLQTQLIFFFKPRLYIVSDKD